MFKGKIITAILILVLFAVSVGFGEGLKENWNDFLHYTKIGRLDLAKGYAQAILASEPDPLVLLGLCEANSLSSDILLRAIENPHDAELAELSKKVMGIIELGRFILRSDPKTIVEEIGRLSGTSRGRLAAVKRLRDAGEYAIPYMLDVIADDSRRGEWPNVVRALSRIGRDSVRPLVAALQSGNLAVKAEIIKALGEIGYPQSLGHLKYVVEKDESGELRGLAQQSIRRIDASALELSAAKLFYGLAEKYYYHAPSLAAAEDADFANVWFWDSESGRLVRVEVDREYFNELMAMRACEWALRADAEFSWAIGLWQAAYFKAESTGVDMPGYFGPGHADAIVYATTAGAEYLHQALMRAVKDENAYVALGAVEALGATAGERSLLYQFGTAGPLVQALTFNDRAVRYSAAIAMAAAGPTKHFPESKLVAEILAEALGEAGQTELVNPWVSQDYCLRSARVMLKLAQSRNPVIDLSIAQSALVNSTKGKRPGIQILTGRVLAYLDNIEAQRSIAAMALDEGNDMVVRLAGFDSLAVSAKLNGCLLDDKMIDAVYSLVGSQEIDPELRSAAAMAFGALNLPSQKVKDLILDQAKS